MTLFISAFRSGGTSHRRSSIPLLRAMTSPERRSSPFATSGGSGIGKTADVLKPLSLKANRKPSVMVNRMSDSELQSCKITDTGSGVIAPLPCPILSEHCFFGKQK